MLARHLGILRDDVAIGYAPHVRRVTKRNWVTFEQGGLFVPTVEAGATLGANSTLGETMDLYGAPRESIRLNKAAIVIGVRRDPVVHTGERAAFVATEWDEYKLA